MRTAFVLLLLLVCGFTYAADPLDAEPKLATPITLRLKITPLDEAVKKIGELTNVKLSVGNSIKAWKCNIFVRDLSAKAVMEALADTMRLDWVKTSQGFQLYETRKRQDERLAYIQAETEASRLKLQKQLSRMARGTVVPFKQVRERYKQITKNPIAALGEPASELSSVMQPMDYLKGCVFAQLNEEAWHRFWQGEGVYASTEALPGAYSLPNDASTYLPEGWPPEGQPILGEKITLFLRYDPVHLCLQEGSMELRDGMPGTSRSEPPNNDLNMLPSSLASMPFAKDVVEWDKDSATDPLHQTEISTKDVGKPSEYSSGYYSDADHLEWLHDQTGVPIVGWAFRAPNIASRLNEVGGKLQDYTANWKRRQGSYFKVRDGVLLHRPGGFWRKGLYEPSEPILRELEAGPTLDGYANAATRLSDAEASVVASPRLSLLRVSERPFFEAMPALRFWGRLSKAQQNAAIAKSDLSLPSLSADQARQYVVCVLEFFFSGGRASEEMVRLLAGGWSPEQTKDWRFTASEGWASTRGPLPKALDDPNETQPRKEISRSYSLIVFHFGPRKGCEVTYSCEWPGRLPEPGRIKQAGR